MGYSNSNKVIIYLYTKNHPKKCILYYYIDEYYIKLHPDDFMHLFALGMAFHTVCRPILINICSIFSYHDMNFLCICSFTKKKLPPRECWYEYMFRYHRNRCNYIGSQIPKLRISDSFAVFFLMIPWVCSIYTDL